MNATAATAVIKADENFPVLKIEEDLDGISMSGCKTTSTSTQTSPIQEVVNKKGSTSTIWTSEESILRSADTVDEDNKSTSSSACEETGVAMSSDKSGECICIFICFICIFLYEHHQHIVPLSVFFHLTLQILSFIQANQFAIR